MEVADKCDDPNAIHRWCIFNREVTKKPNWYKNHFSLTEEKRALLETVLGVNLQRQERTHSQGQYANYSILKSTH